MLTLNRRAAEEEEETEESCGIHAMGLGTFKEKERQSQKEVKALWDVHCCSCLILDITKARSGCTVYSIDT
jgi:hypothetical protein